MDVLTSSILDIKDVISNQQPQFMGNRWTLRMSQYKANSSFFSFARTMPYLGEMSALWHSKTKGPK